MKKFLAAIATLLAVVPFIGANALNEETTNYYEYTKGDIVNFYYNPEVEARHQKEALETMVLEDKGTSEKFVKVWMIAEGWGVSDSPIQFSTGGTVYTFKNPNPVQDTRPSYLGLAALYEQNNFYNGSRTDKNNYFLDFKDAEEGLDLLSLEDLINYFGAVKKSDVLYEIPDFTRTTRDNIDISFYEELQKIAATSVKSAKNGIWTSSIADAATKKVWMIKLVYTDNKVTNVKVEPVSVTEIDEDGSKEYAIIPTAYANKTADCHTPPIVEEHCYKCKKNDNGEFEWVILKDNDSRIPDNCEKEENSSKCNPNTGSKSHLLEFSIVAALCAISLLVVRRKDLFRTM